MKRWEEFRFTVIARLFKYDGINSNLKINSRYKIPQFYGQLLIS